MSTFIDRNSGVIDAVSEKLPVNTVALTNVPLYGLIVIGGSYQLLAGDRILVNGQTDKTQNGIYVAQTNAWNRSQDFNSGRNITPGTRVIVLIPGGFSFIEYALSPTTPKPIIVGVTAFVFLPVNLRPVETLANLPFGVEGMLAFAKDVRKIGEGPGAGTGASVIFTGGLWYVESTDEPALI